MSDIINLLPDSVANQIAAGEVIQRPASAVKELLENSLDAHASEIKLIVKDAGRTLVQVVDNGIGMSETDARMSFERHATSKLKDINDLFSLHTFGFRGEALASIASIAQVEMKTRRKEDELGILLQVDGSIIKSQEPCQCSIGTSIAMKNIFFNVPARRQFLKSDAAEMRHIVDEFFRVALVNPKVKFELYHNDKLEYSLFPALQKQRIIDILGEHIGKSLIGFEQEMPNIRITGFIGKPEFAQKTKGDQYFFVNGRFVKYPYLHHAVMGVYEEFLKDGKVPAYVIQFELDPKTIDVNIHPTKTEVKFSEEKLIYGVLFASVKKALGISNVKPSIDFNLNTKYNFGNFGVKSSTVGGHSSQGGGFTHIPIQTANPTNAAYLQQYGNLIGSENFRSQTSSSGIEGELMYENAVADDVLHHFQFQSHYLVVGMTDRILLIDPKNASERIEYEKVMRKLSEERQNAVSQTKLFPQTLELSPSNADVLLELIPSLVQLGWEINQLGNFDFVINASPAEIKENDVKDVLFSLLESYKNNLLNHHNDRITNIALSVAKSMSLKRGQKLTEQAQKQLLESLFQTSEPQISPSGKSIFSIISEDEIQLKFD
ncbi:MAG: DNA mismatch repair endonuclease MutL [Bacteroidales bacterium]|jgi:DNA mismatch repair protein MutL|nr:DNA mismatch repair endonuclease MutL [Bacteroidales bacterium]